MAFQKTYPTQFLTPLREKTRLERYNEKLKNASYIPGYLATINFIHDDNLALLIRSCACFGMKGIFVIGSIPPRNFLKPKSGSTLDLVDIKSFPNPASFLRFAREQEFEVLSLEITESSRDIREYPFDFSHDTVFVVGNESYGIPEEILINTHHIHINMNGPGFCLNSAQAGTVLAYEYTSRYLNRDKQKCQ